MKKIVLIGVLCSGLLSLHGAEWPDKPLGGGEKLFFDEQTFTEVRHRIDTYPWAARIYEKLQSELGGNAGSFPGQQNEWVKGQWCRDAAYYYRISGDDSYIPAVVEYLVKRFSLDRPGFNMFANVTRMNQNFWNLGMFSGGCFIAYDLIRNHPAMAPYAGEMEARLADIAAEGHRYSYYIRRLGNTQFWAVTTMAMAAYLTGNESLIDESINGKHGFKALLATFRDEGRFFGEPFPYAMGYVNCCLAIHAELARFNGGEDLYRYVAPNGASIKRMLESFLQVADPSGLALAHGDIGQYARPANGRVYYEGTRVFSGESARPQFLWEIYNAVYRDPAMAWAIARNPERNDKDVTFWGYTALTHGAPIDHAATPESKTGWFPESGNVVIKTAEGADYWDSGSLMLHFRTGSSLSFHSHNDHFHFTLNAFGKNIYNDWFWEWDYLAPRANNGQANATPMSPKLLAHNTVVVDGREPDKSFIKHPQNQPEEYGAVPTPIRRQGNMQSFSAEWSMYDGVTHQRTMAVTPDYVIDIFRITADSVRHFDYVLHSLGTAEVTGVGEWIDYPAVNADYALQPINKNSQRGDNVWLADARKGAAPGDIRASFVDYDGIGARTTVLGTEPSEVITAALPLYVFNNGTWGGKNHPGIPDRKPVMMVRRKGTATTYYALHQPFRGDATPELDFSRRGDVLTVKGAGFTDTYNITTGDYKRRKK